LNLDDIVSKLHENERKILLELKNSQASTTMELSGKTGLRRDAVEKASSWAETKGVVSSREERSSIFDLTEEGRRYSDDGLPERRLINLVASGKNEIKKLKEILSPLDIALSWIFRNNWAKIVDGKLVLTKIGKEILDKNTNEENLLNELRAGPLNDSSIAEQNEKTVTNLLKRGLLSKTEEILRLVEITDLGLMVIPYIQASPEGIVITQLTPEHIQTGKWRKASFQNYDISLPVRSIKPGKRHFISQVIDYIRRFWLELGFEEMKGDYLELSFWNFDALFQPQDHPARDLADTFYMKNPSRGVLPASEIVQRVKETHENGWTTGSYGWQYAWNPVVAEKCCLRTHTTSISVRTIARLTEEDLPAKFFSVGRVFRNETIDWNHLIEFYQTDGIVIGEEVTFRNLLGYLKAYLEGLGLKKFRFRPGYFPYTEMSLEAEVWIDEKKEWMELFGAGIFRPEVVKPLFGRDVPVLAWGPGFDRLVMQSYGLNTIKELYSNDIELLRKANLWMR
jgi:phenylalanyl-tRNA synthetase alpha chain